MTKYKDQAIVILAAGSSSRMGSPKQLLSIGNETLLERTISCAKASNVPNIFVVLGANANEVRETVKSQSIKIIQNPNWQSGMGSSIKVGVKHLAEGYGEIQAIMLLVCDQPLLTADHINSLAEANRITKPIVVASSYKGTYGVPAVFGRIAFSDLLSISDRAGAKSVLKKLEKKLQLIPFEGGEIDLDTPEDYERFKLRKKLS